MSVMICFSTHVLRVVMFLHEFALNYSRTDALHTKKVVKKALIDVIEKG